MIKLRIDHIDISVEEHTTVLEAARTHGISIPSMCYFKGYSNHPSCMLCVVKDLKTGHLFCSCAMQVTEGMDLISQDDEITQARKDALELLMSDHVGDCEAPCALTCPAGMNIPLMNRLIADAKFEEALQIVKEEIAIPLILGYVCAAPCEKACRRKQIDKPISICLLKRFVAAENLTQKDKIPTTVVKQKKLNHIKKIAIIGAGPAGLAAAFYLHKMNYQTVVFDKNEAVGGSLRYQIPEDLMPKTIVDDELNLLIEMGVQFVLNFLVTKDFLQNTMQSEYDAIVIANGINTPDSFLSTMLEMTKTGIMADEGSYKSSVAGIFICGSAIREQNMAVRSVAQGKAAALSVDAYLRKLNVERSSKRFNSKFDKLIESEYKEYLKEASSSDRIEPMNGLLMGFSKQEVIEEAKRCLHCDCRKQDDCSLRKYSHQYNVDRRKYSTDFRNLIVKYFEHDNVVYEPEKCIRCGLCVDIACKNNETTGLTFTGRGFDVRIQVPFSRPMSEALLKCTVLCVNSCPTAALSFKKIKN